MALYVSETFDDASPYSQVAAGNGTSGTTIVDGAVAPGKLQTLTRSAGAPPRGQRYTKDLAPFQSNDAHSIRCKFTYTINDMGSSITAGQTYGGMGLFNDTTPTDANDFGGMFIYLSSAPFDGYRLVFQIKADESALEDQINIAAPSSRPGSIGSGGTGTFIYTNGGGMELYVTTSNGTTFGTYPVTGSYTGPGFRFNRFGGVVSGITGQNMDITWDDVEAVDGGVTVTIGDINIDSVMDSLKITEQVDAAGLFTAVCSGSTFVDRMRERASQATTVAITQGVSATTVWTGYLERVQASSRDRTIQLEGRDEFRALMKTTVAEPSQFNTGGRTLDAGPPPAAVASDSGAAEWNDVTTVLLKYAGHHHKHSEDFYPLSLDNFTANQTAASLTDDPYSYEYHTTYDALMDSFRNTGYGFGDDFKHFWFTGSSFYYGYPRDPVTAAATAINRWVADAMYRYDTFEKYDSAIMFYRTSGTTTSAATWGDAGQSDRLGGGYYGVFLPDDRASHAVASSSSFSDYAHFESQPEGIPTLAQSQILYDTLSTAQEQLEILAGSLLLGEIRPNTKLTYTDDFLGLSSRDIIVRKLVHNISQRKRDTRIWFDYAANPITKAQGNLGGGFIQVESASKNRNPTPGTS